MNMYSPQLLHIYDQCLCIMAFKNSNITYSPKQHSLFQGWKNIAFGLHVTELSSANGWKTSGTISSHGEGEIVRPKTFKELRKVTQTLSPNWGE